MTHLNKLVSFYLRIRRNAETRWVNMGGPAASTRIKESIDPSCKCIFKQKTDMDRSIHRSAIKILSRRWFDFRVMSNYICFFGTSGNRDYHPLHPLSVSQPAKFTTPPIEFILLSNRIYLLIISWFDCSSVREGINNHLLHTWKFQLYFFSLSPSLATIPSFVLLKAWHPNLKKSLRRLAL